MLIALDSNVFIAALSSKEEYSTRAQIIIRDIASGKHKAVASSIVYGEVYGISIASQPLDLLDFFSHIENLETIPANDSLCIRAGKLRLKYGSKLKLPDAMHLATALNNNSDLFLTNDQQLSQIAKKMLPTKMLSELP